MFYAEKDLGIFSVIIKMMTNDDTETAKNAGRYFCEKCDFKCSKRSNFNVHLSTEKHKMMTNDDIESAKNAKAYICECGKRYKYRQGLSVHKKNCKVSEPKLSSLVDSNNKMNAEAILELLKQNKELQKHIITNNIVTTNNITNNNNQKVNINMFLNEQCKDALNFSDFIDRIEITHEDLENNAELGFVNGVSKILSDNLNQLTLYERPLHCTDIKRDTLYIKDEHMWNKEKDQVKKKMFNGIQKISRKSVGELLQWKKENPDYQNIDSDFSNKCMVIQREIMGGHDRDKSYGRIMHNMCTEVQMNQKTME